MMVSPHTQCPFSSATSSQYVNNTHRQMLAMVGILMGQDGMGSIEKTLHVIALLSQSLYSRSIAVAKQLLS